MVDTQTLETGCYIDSHHGIYGLEMLYDLAVDLCDHDAWPRMDEDGRIVRHSLHGDVGATLLITDTTGHPEVVSYTTVQDYAGELYDELETRLNDEAAAEDHAWGWWEGDFMYWPIDSWQDV